MVTNDIYRFINLEKEEYVNKAKETKKEIIEEELKKYIISKLNEIGNINSIKEENIVNLFKLLENVVPQKQHEAILSPIIHYILMISSSLQEHQIIWWQDEDLMVRLIAQFDETGKWDCIRVHNEVKYSQIFSFVYDTFKTDFIKIGKTKKFIYRCE